MPSNQRENARREKQEQKERKTKSIIWVVLAVIIVALIIMKVCEIDFASIKDYFTDENGNFSISSSSSTNYPYEMDSSNVTVNTVNDKLSLLSSSSLTILNPSNGEVNYSFTHGYSNPIISQAGNYICLIDQGSNRFRLDTTTENVYESNTQNKILTADVSKNGTIVYATQSDTAKSTLCVVSKALANQMTLDDNTGYITDVAIDKSGKKIAVATVNSKDAKLITTVSTFRVGDEVPTEFFEFENAHIMDLHYSSSSDLFVVGTDMVSVITNQKNLNVVYDVGEVSTVCYGYTDSDELVYAYSKYAGDDGNVLAYITDNGKEKMSVDLPQKPKYISSSSNYITVLYADKIVNYSLTKGEEKETFSCDETLKTANRMSSKIFVTRQQLVDVIG